VPRAGGVADEIAGPEHRAVAVDQLAFEHEKVFDARMDVRDGDGARLHAHEVAALAGGAIEADRQPADLRLQRPVEIIFLKGGGADIDDAPTIRCFRHQRIPPA
jgi:hypothetical protein